jgi:hypothetical protein
VPFTSRIYNVFIASPSDLEEEREIATKAIHEWNDQNSARESVVFLPVKFETHVPPTVPPDIQVPINRLVRKCDVLIGIFGQG